MHLTAVAAVATAFLPWFAGALQLTNSAYNGIQAGKKFEVTWSGDGTPVDIVLESGPSNNLQAVQTLAFSAKGTNANVTIPDNITANTKYAFLIKQSGQSNYSPQFTITPSSTSTSSASSSSSSSSSDSSDDLSDDVSSNNITALPSDIAANLTDDTTFPTSAFLSALSSFTTHGGTTQTGKTSKTTATHNPASPSTSSSPFYGFGGSSGGNNNFDALNFSSSVTGTGKIKTSTTASKSSSTSTKKKSGTGNVALATASGGFGYGSNYGAGCIGGYGDSGSGINNNNNNHNNNNNGIAALATGTGTGTGIDVYSYCGTGSPIAFTGQAAPGFGRSGMEAWRGLGIAVTVVVLGLSVGGGGFFYML